jgi:hypothetical protein
MMNKQQRLEAKAKRLAEERAIKARHDAAMHALRPEKGDSPDEVLRKKAERAKLRQQLIANGLG